MKSRGHLAAFVALLALALQLLIPAGFMPAAGASGPALVICTDHGPLLLGGDHGQPGKPQDSKSGGVCAFAGHGAPPIEPPAVFLTPTAFTLTTGPVVVRVDLALGRGLAAPPPPSQGPPVQAL